MKANILWAGREYHSLENCLVNCTDSENQISSTIVGYYNKKIYGIKYRIDANSNWETILVEIRSRHNHQEQIIRLESNGRGKWFRDGKHCPQYEGCMDIDIPLTPFTNSLPINRLKLTKGSEQDIKVVYIDLLANDIMTVLQKYKRLSDTEYHYENVPNDFEADIKVDEFGLVVDYPLLFERIAIENSFAQ